MTQLLVRLKKWRNAFFPVSLSQALILLFAWTFFVAPSCADELPKRLSAWLSARKISAEDYPLGLLWEVPSEEAGQAKLRSQLLIQIDGSHGNPQVTQRLHDWIARMPVTGRVPVSIADAEWLGANPQHDPMILPGHRVILPKLPQTVTLITSRGVRCQLKHAAGVSAVRYVAGCDPAAAKQVDWAWVVQPDGKVSRYGVAHWNAQRQDEPAPGAWVWVPYREDQWADNLSASMAEFLATQGVAPEPVIASDVLELSDAAENISRFAEPAVTANDWGAVGLLQTPTARMRPESQGSITLNRIYPYTRTNFFLQPFDWMEFGFRYTSVSNRLYGPTIAGGQAYKDKSMDVKFSLLDESAYLPQVALGLRDITGTGLFSGEFLVANKRYGAFDWSMGLGWGYLGGRGNLGNPFSIFGSGFRTRPPIVIGQGGNFSVSSYFRGATSLFGGVQYQSPWESLIFKLEYDGNNYQHEPLGNNLRQDTPWNIGAVYRPWQAVELSFGLERGNRLMLGLTLQTDLQKMATPKLDDPAPFPVLASRPQRMVDGSVLAADLASQTGWSIRGIEQNGRKLQVKVDEAEAAYWGERIDRAAAVLNYETSAEVNEFSIEQRQFGTTLVEHQIDRESWVQQQTQPLPPGMQLDPVVTRPVVSPTVVEKNQSLYNGTRPTFESESRLGLNYGLGGPNGFILYQVYAEENAKLWLGDSTWMQGRLDLGLIDNYNRFTFDTVSYLPRVRTHVREYVTRSRITMPNLQTSHVGRLTDNQYFSVYAGYLEWMFAGVGAEWLYRSFGSPVAFGIDVNRVSQRDFMQNFALLNPAYQVDTGHATLYWDTGWDDVLAKISAGRYLAGDKGVTIDVSRVFRNGVRMGGFFTKTNVSAVQFGEGSYDKGVYVSIPFDAMYTKSTGMVANILWQPLLRDGGAKLDRELRLYDVTQLLDERTMQYRPADLENLIPVPSQVQKSWGRKDGEGTRLFDRQILDTAYSDANNFDATLMQSSTWKAIALGLGATALSSGFDQGAFNWAQRHVGSSSIKSIANIGNGLPILAMGTSLLISLDGSDERMSNTAYTSLQAGTMALVLTEASKMAVGRSRPGIGVSSHSFHAFSMQNGNTSFPSMHTSVMWAAITPYAKEYDMTWLYGVAALTNFARVADRKHWVSDTVAGSLLGYAIGNLAWQWNRNASGNYPKLGVDGKTLTLSWDTP